MDRRPVRTGLTVAGATTRRWAYRLLARRRLYRAFDLLGRVADVGRNWGNVDEPETSGELHVLDLLHDPAVVLDLGANRGEYANAVLARWPRCRVLAVDPALDRFDLDLAPGVERHAVAVGAAAGPAWLVTPFPGSKLGRVQPDAADGAEPVPMVTLDELCAGAGVARIDLLKLDVEGGELDVLRGARGLLDDDGIGVVQFEFGLANLSRGHRLSDVLELLGDRRLHAITVDGLRPIGYHERLEVGATRNLVAVPR